MAPGKEAEIEPGLKRVPKYQNRILYPQLACLHTVGQSCMQFGLIAKILKLGF